MGNGGGDRNHGLQHLKELQHSVSAGAYSPNRVTVGAVYDKEPFDLTDFMPTNQQQNAQKRNVKNVMQSNLDSGSDPESPASFKGQDYDVYQQIEFHIKEPDVLNPVEQLTLIRITLIFVLVVGCASSLWIHLGDL